MASECHQRNCGMWAFEGASKVIWGEKTPGGVGTTASFTKPGQSQPWTPGLPDSQTRVLCLPRTAQPKGDQAGTSFLLPLCTMEQCCGVKRIPVSSSPDYDGSQLFGLPAMPCWSITDLSELYQLFSKDMWVIDRPSYYEISARIWGAQNELEMWG